MTRTDCHAFVVDMIALALCCALMAAVGYVIGRTHCASPVEADEGEVAR